MAVALLLLTVVSCSDADDERGVEDLATAITDAEEADEASNGEIVDGQSGTVPTEASDLGTPEDEADQAVPQQDGDPEPSQANPEEIDPFEELEWALTPAGPESPSVNEDLVYRVLASLDPQRCQELLADPDDRRFAPASFETGERSVHLFRAGAMLCAGDGAAAETAYRRALGFEWPSAARQPVHSRVCNVWDAVTRMVDPGAGPCTLEQLAVDTTGGGDDGSVDDPSSGAPGEESTDTDDPTDGDDPTDSDEPTDSDPSQTDPSDTDEPPVTDDAVDAPADDAGS